MSYYNLTDKTKQLDEEVLKYYFKEYKKGNLAARGILIEKNIRLVEAIIKKYSTYFDQDDLVQIGCVGLIKAVDTFDIDRCSKFSNYAGICIDNEIRMFLRKNYKYINIISIDDANSKFIIDNMLSCEVADLVLDYEDKEHYTQQEIADKFGQSRFTIGRKIKNIICELIDNMYKLYDIKNQKTKI